MKEIQKIERNFNNFKPNIKTKFEFISNLAQT